MAKTWAIRPGLRHLLGDGLTRARRVVSQNAPTLLAPSFPGMTGEGDCRLIGSPRFHEKEADSRAPVVATWPEDGLLSARWPVLIFLLEGQCDIRFGIIDGEAPYFAAVPASTGQYVVTMDALQFLLLPSRFPRPDGSCIHWERPDSQNTTATLMWFIFSPIGCFVHFCRTDAGEHTQSNSIYLPASHVFQLVEGFEAEILQQRPAWRMAARNYLEILMIELQRQATNARHQAGFTRLVGQPEAAPESGTDPLPQASHRTLQNACSYIEEHLHETLRASQIAHFTGASPFGLNQIFRKHLHLTVSQYIINRRIERAKTMLRDSNLSISLVAQQSGFNHLEHFSRTFKRHAEISPLAYRRRYHEPAS